MSTDPMPSAPAPTTDLLNAGSLTRWLLALIAGWLGKLGFDGDQSATIAAGLLALAVGAWHIYKNRAVTRKLAVAMTSPPVQLVNTTTPGSGAAGMIAFALACLVAAHTLSACATKPIVTPGSSASVYLAEGTTTLDASYNVAAKAYLAALPAMSKTAHDQWKPVLMRAYQLTQAVDSGTVLAGETSVIGEIADAQAMIDAVKAVFK